MKDYKFGSEPEADAAVSRSRRWRSKPSRSEVILANTIDVSNLFYDGIVQSLVKRGVSVRLVSSAGTNGPRLFSGIATLHCIQMQRAPAPLRDLRALLQWIALLARVRPKTLVVGTPKAALLGGVAGRLTRVPSIVYVVHGIRGERATGGLGILLAVIEAITIKCAHRVLAVSPSLRRELLRSHPEARSKTVVLGHGSLNGVDAQRFAPPSPNERLAARTRWGLSAEPVIGFVGRVERDKGGEFLMRLMDDPRIIQLGAHLLMVGDLEDESLRKDVDKLIAEGRATVTGWTEVPEQHMAALDVLVHPTRREGLGMVILEAQSMGIPVLTNEVTGTVDALVDGVGGHFPKADSIHSWVDGICDLTLDDSSRSEIGAAGRRFVLERFNRTEVVERFVEYLSTVDAQDASKEPNAES